MVVKRRRISRKALRDRKRDANNIIYRAHNTERGIHPKSFFRAQALLIRAEGEQTQEGKEGDS